MKKDNQQTKPKGFRLTYLWLKVFVISIATIILSVMHLSSLKFPPNEHYSPQEKASFSSPLKHIIPKTSYSCEDSEPFTEFVLVGERHTGTNFVTDIIEKNLKETLSHVKVNENIHQWKHGFLDGYNFRLKKNQALLVITRDVFTWLPKMYKESYCHGSSPLAINKYMSSIEKGNKKMDKRKAVNPFSSFIRHSYNCESWKGFLDRETRNLVALRTSKYKNWLNSENPDYFEQEHFGCSRAHLTYESIVEDQAKSVGDVLARFKMKKDNFDTVDNYVKFGKSNRKFYEPSTESILNKYYTVDDIKFVLSEIDLDFEANILNRKYDYVFDYLKVMDKKSF